MSDRVLFVDQKLKRKMEDREELLTLRLGYNNSSKHLKASEVSGNSSSKHVEVSQYSCNYCDMKFPNFQALGGHQHGYAHKYQRTLLTWGKDLSLKPYEIESHAPDNAFPMKNPSFQFKSPLDLLDYATMLKRFMHRPRSDMSSGPLGQGSYANHAGPNTSFTASPQFGVNRLLGGGVGGIPQRLNHVVDLQKLNQVPPFVEGEAHRIFQGAPLEGLQEEELDLSLTLKR